MGSLLEAIEAEEVVVRGRVEELEAHVAELTVRLEAERERLSRLVITRETAGELLARMAGCDPAEPVRAEEVSPFAGAERRVVGVLAVPKWQPGLEPGVLPRVYQDILEVLGDAPGPVRAKQVVPRIGLPAETAKIEGDTREAEASGRTRLAGRGLARPVHPVQHQNDRFAQLALKEGLFLLDSKVPTKTNHTKEEPKAEQSHSRAAVRSLLSAARTRSRPMVCGLLCSPALVMKSHEPIAPWYGQPLYG